VADDEISHRILVGMRRGSQDTGREQREQWAKHVDPRTREQARTAMRFMQ
jgi:hypothetical protein